MWKNVEKEFQQIRSYKVLPLTRRATEAKCTNSKRVNERNGFKGQNRIRQGWKKNDCI